MNKLLINKPWISIAWLAALTSCGSSPGLSGSEIANLVALENHEAAGDTDKAALAMQPEALTAATCDLSGSWAIRLDIPTYWNATLAVSAGEGMVTQWAHATRQQQEDTLLDEITLCGATVPDTKALEMILGPGGETYGIVFPDALFDKSTLPKSSLIIQLQRHNPQHVTFSADAISLLLGLTMEHPESDAWPSQVRQIKQIDADFDGKPGVTLYANLEPGYRGPPVNFSFSKRARAFHVASRNVVTNVRGQVNDCDSMTGLASIPIIKGEAAINSHIIGCEHLDGKLCTAKEANSLDSKQSGLRVSGDVQVYMHRLPVGETSCAAVRNFHF